jgi:hypothetical protein
VVSLVLFAAQGTSLESISVFRILGILIVGLSIVSSLTYIFVLKEPYLSKEAKRLQKEFKLN